MYVGQLITKIKEGVNHTIFHPPTKKDKLFISARQFFL